jgi:hypothetical protein
MISDISDDVSVLSGGTSSIPSSLAPVSHSTNARSRPRLSPVSEISHLTTTHSNSDQQSIDKHFEMITPAVSIDQVPKLSTGNPSRSHDSPLNKPAPVQENLFARKKVPPIKPQQSALSSMLNGGKSSNPFTETYASVSGRSAAASITVSVYFPHAKRPAGKPLDLVVSRDATVEEIIGFALWTFCEEGWLPKLDEGLSGPDDPKWEDRISACGWILRLAEEDGEVDDDFPRMFFVSFASI